MLKASEILRSYFDIIFVFIMLDFVYEKLLEAHLPCCISLDVQQIRLWRWHFRLRIKCGGFCSSIASQVAAKIMYGAALAFVYSSQVTDAGNKYFSTSLKTMHTYYKLYLSRLNSWSQLKHQSYVEKHPLLNGCFAQLSTNIRLFSRRLNVFAPEILA